MSLPVMHTAVGMSAPFLVGVAGFLKSGRVTSRALLVLTVSMLICGLWAEVPDMPKVLLHRWVPHDAPWVNIFFFHQLLDKYQSEDRGLVEGFVVGATIFFLILLACGRTVIRNATEISRLKSRYLAKKYSQTIPKTIAYKDVVDIHCHVLPGVDDGPATIEESIAMCRRAVELGVAHIVATPHLPWHGDHNTDIVLASYSLLKEHLDIEGVSLKLSLGSDIRIAWDLIEKLRRTSVFTLAGSRYFLLELDDITVPERLEDFIVGCATAGYYPILTHPERNRVLQSDIGRLKEMSKLPMLIQLSSCSLVGIGGERAKAAALAFLGAGLVNVIASDAHAVNMRLEEFPQGLAIAEKIVGKDVVYGMVVESPGLIIRNEMIDRVKACRSR